MNMVGQMQQQIRPKDIIQSNQQYMSSNHQSWR